VQHPWPRYRAAAQLEEKMEGLGPATPFARVMAEALQDARFTLLDIGCSGGIHPAWRVFGNRLTAFGFDPNLEEIERLSRQETLPAVTYVPGLIGLPPDDPGIARLRAGDFFARSPWQRLSVARTLEIRADAIARADTAEKTRMNQWQQVRLADPKTPIMLPDFLSEHGVTDVDFIKIDVDGADFILLRSLVPLLHEAKVLGLGIEVNFFGSDDAGTHTFHNVDRLMKRAGFELFALSTRPYSVAALPSAYRFAVPGESVSGRPLQGDAIYLRDAAASEHATWARETGPHKLAKLAALFSLTGLPDCAAELLVSYSTCLEPLLDVPAALDMLTTQTMRPGQPICSYREYITAFEADAPQFYSAFCTPGSDGTGEREDAANNAIDELRCAVAKEASQRCLAEAALELAKEEARQLREDIAALRLSTSWRMTGPLRSVTGLLRQIWKFAA
jgi:Methyltransferase FkbM domain